MKNTAHRAFTRPRSVLHVVSWALFLVLSPLQVCAAGLIQAQGNKLLIDGREIHLRGTNLGNLLMQEDFMVGLYGTHTQMRGAMYQILGGQKAAAFWNTYEDIYYIDEDAAYLHSQGFNPLRLPLNQNRLEDPNTPGKYDQSAFDRIDRIIRISKAHGIYVILDIHAVLGGNPPTKQQTNAQSQTAFGMQVD